MPVNRPSGAEHGATGYAAWEMGSGPAEQKMKTRAIFLDGAEKPDRVFLR
jgi:hypothetical protein